MFSDNCGAKSLFGTFTDSLNKALMTDGLSNFIISMYVRIDNKKTAIAMAAGTAGYMIRTIYRQCMDDEYELNMLGVTIKPYHIVGVIIGGAVKYIFKNTQSQHLTRDILLGAFNGVGCEVFNDLKIYGVLNLAITLTSLKLIESGLKADDFITTIKGAAAVSIAALGFQYLYVPIKNDTTIYTEQFLDKISDLYLWGLNGTYDEYI